MSVTNHSLKVFTESLDGKFWVSEPKGVARAYFGGGFRQAYVEFKLGADGEVDLSVGSHVASYIKTNGDVSPQWLSSQKKLAVEESRPQLLAVAGFVQIDSLNEGAAVDLQRHSEEWYEVGDGLCVAVADAATVAGVPVGSGGAHLIKDGKLWRPAASEDLESNYKVAPIPEKTEDAEHGMVMTG